MNQQAANWKHGLEHAALSDIGLRRANNQDAMAVVLAGSEQTWHSRGHLFVVADGMGAHAAGELASKIAVDTVCLTYSKLADLPPHEAIKKSLEEANGQIYGRGLAEPEFKGMGTTCTALVLLPQGVIVGHVGDSRAYRVRGNRLDQLTFDHSLVWEMRVAGDLSEQDIPSYVPRNIITRSLGPSSKVQVDLEGPFPIAEGDSYLLCSDGLTGPVDDEEIGVILQALPPDEASRALVDLANLRGGPDNITVTIARVARMPNVDDVDSSPRRAPAGVVHSVVWILLGVFGLATVGAAAIKYWPAALVFLLGSILLGIVAVVQRTGESKPQLDAPAYPFGKGPHTTANCSVGKEFVDRMCALANELKDSAIREDWTVDWPRFDKLLATGDSARAAGDHLVAVAAYCRALSFMMAQLKQQNSSGNDSR